LLVTAALSDWNHADAIEVMIGLDSWHPTRGTRITGEKNTEQRVVVAEGRLVPVSSPRSEKIGSLMAHSAARPWLKCRSPRSF
jgi:hypothetical protein